MEKPAEGDQSKIASPMLHESAHTPSVSRPPIKSAPGPGQTSSVASRNPSTSGSSVLDSSVRVPNSKSQKPLTESSTPTAQTGPIFPETGSGSSGTSFIVTPAGVTSTIEKSNDPALDPEGSPASIPATQEQAVSDSQGQGARVAPDISVPSGMKVPAAALDNGDNVTPQQRAELDEILENFSQDVAAVNPAAPTPSQLETWEAARKKADNSYRVLFGNAAFNALTMDAALEALAEKQTPNQ